MNAIQPSRPPLYPVEPDRKRSPRPRRRLRQRRNPHQSVAVEASLRLAVNVVVGMVAIASIVRLLPQNISQQQKLNTLQTDVAALELRVDRLQESFARQFDPGQTRSVMQEETGRIGIGQRPIVWIKPSSEAAGVPVPASASGQASESPETVSPVVPPDTTPITPPSSSQAVGSAAGAISNGAAGRASAGPWAW
jgi:cell division protein FtsB